MSFGGAAKQRNASAGSITVFHRAIRARAQFFDVLQHVGHTFERLGQNPRDVFLCEAGHTCGFNNTSTVRQGMASLTKSPGIRRYSAARQPAANPNRGAV